MRPALVCCALLMSTTFANAGFVTYMYTGPTPVNIPDNNSTGVALNIVVPDTFQLNQFQSVTLTGLVHTWVGDLIATLTHLPSGRTIDLFRRVGAAAPTGVGDSTNLGGDYTFSNTLTVSNLAQPRLVDAASLLDGAQAVPGGVYRPTTNTFTGGANFAGETQVSLNGVFNGLANINGTWQLRISDNANLDLGTIRGWSMTVEVAAVPVPPSLMVFGLGLAMTAAGRFFARRRS
jgi:hypothetical protein